MKTTARFISFLFLCLSLSVHCMAWGQKGHDTTCAIAQRHLTPAALQEITALLDGKSIVYWANWLDNASNTDEYAYSKTWHYKNIDAADTYETAPLLETGDVVRAIEAQKELLADKKLDKATRQLALKMLIHLVGDMHQPLHLGHKIDLGGNRWRVNFFGHDTNLHTVWDTDLVESTHAWAHTEWAEELDRLDAETVRQICRGTADDWAKESYAIAKDIYAGTPESSELSYGYIRTWEKTVEQQLLNGGLRLAWLLNSIL